MWNLENSAGRPRSEEGGSFIVDFVLKEFFLCGLSVALSSPPTHLHLKNREQLVYLQEFKASRTDFYTDI